MDQVKYIKYVYNKERYRKESKRKLKIAEKQDVTAQPSQINARGEERAYCKARILLNYKFDKGIFIITSWIIEHNHILHSKDSSFMLRSNRSVDLVHEVVARMNDNARIKLRPSFEVMTLAVEGRKNLGFLPIDLKNYLRNARKIMMKKWEVFVLQKYFRKQTYQNPSFYYEIEIDSNEEVIHIFWADERMKMDCRCYGDAICFDTTYRANKEYRPLALFVGWNYHRKGCIFGAALLYEETTEAFYWLFRAFLKCNGDKAPRTIFTDQDPTIVAALKMEFPNTFHALYTWHIQKNVQKNLGTLNTADFASQFNYIMYDVDNEEEFKFAWQKMVKECFKGKGHS